MGHWPLLDAEQRQLVRKNIPEFADAPDIRERKSLFGEAFLNFHHYLHLLVSREMAAANLCMIPGWENFTANDDPQFPLNVSNAEDLQFMEDYFEGVENIGIGLVEAAMLFQTALSAVPVSIPDKMGRYMADDGPGGGLASAIQQASNISDPRYLKNASLSEVGYDIFHGLHSVIHIRMCFQQYQHHQWDFMIDAYADPAAPTFWKLHGFIERQLHNWLAANNYDKAAIDCRGQPACYTWKSTWALSRIVKMLPKVKAATRP
ncbi:hypothetical protein CYMTET_54165 [Cymbomonas tetramitiformis]|uniref:Uncharacterized protein n=1 Tax=Cymbomonas tetramitiformis TaxID=36881 RepID=A0AAE0EPM2_9CHLO|nr:hypothetical protein CYMTET_54165 [Cymbomonas tetramitiformis]